MYGDGTSLSIAIVLSSQKEDGLEYSFVPIGAFDHFYL